jgi:hypothetical protein
MRSYQVVIFATAKKEESENGHCFHQVDKL